MWRPKNCEALIESLFTRLLAALFGYAIVAAREVAIQCGNVPHNRRASGLLSRWGPRSEDRPAWRGQPKGVWNRSGTSGDLYLDEELLRGEGLKRTVIIFAWILAMFLLGWLLGQRIALPLFVFLYLKVGSKEG